MATKVTGSPSICLFSSRGKNCQYLHFPYSGSFNLPMVKGQCKIKNPNHFFKFGAKYGIYNHRCVQRRNFQLKASASGDHSPSSSWKKWLLGLLLTVILPAVGHKGGLFAGLKSKIDAAVKTVETVTEIVEEVAEEVEKVVEEVEEKLPQDSKLKEALESVENLAKKAVKEAKQAEELVHKVQSVEETIEGTIEGALMKANTDETKLKG
ncbi:uncharacterized protein LOC111389010 isoform X1 [Olea europaea var. sylvestris]|uniref:uncharacterized protein LOC111389010 isoform X1 n=1 Tax=Olea europaea var. sylvestris TaxID=158386 RepID=UPI000C1D77C4|nr:uncharacterized protein LOC111389010 isoform X1 [Olea europaea var. sylvestris]